MQKLFLFLAACAALATSPAHAVVLVDRIVAVVNKDVVTYSELNEAVGMAERQLARQGTAAPERAVLERQMLERLIVDKAQLQLARESGLRIDDPQLGRAGARGGRWRGGRGAGLARGGGGAIPTRPTR